MMIAPIGDAVLGPGGKTLPLAPGVQVGPIVYLSGQVAMIDGVLSGGGIAEQTQIVLDNIEAALATAGLTLADVFKVTVWITRQEDFASFNAAYATRFQAPYPTRSTVVSGLVVPGALIEIEACAAARS